MVEVSKAADWNAVGSACVTQPRECGCIIGYHVDDVAALYGTFPPDEMDDKPDVDNDGNKLEDDDMQTILRVHLQFVVGLLDSLHVEIQWD
jgi:hypothetical protein